MAVKNAWTRPAGTDGYIPVNVLWQRMAALYGAEWRAMFADEAAKLAWQEEAAAMLYGRGVSFNMIKQALEVLRNRVKSGDKPPSVTELVELAMPSIDAESSFAEAKKQSALVQHGRAEWSDPAVYWAAVDFGFSRLTTAQFRGRDKADWVRALARRLSGQCPGIPVAEPVPEYQRGDVAVARASLANLAEMLGKKVGSKAVMR
ncbi:hypothetical protein HZU75_04280 [Chitinibacter fontanus]|uniref:Uncharacterized protein n=1 Tax=Chitinibacter fontanus TaxID=1737446 RepID=A0A7D5ZE79_9NEIS|nr:hypothetical protein [Chitinibacter fontanus]QLI80808.1 hypothetical protein HZU75_04280 [Chitinibacter fontanus]